MKKNKKKNLDSTFKFVESLSIEGWKNSNENLDISKTLISILNAKSIIEKPKPLTRKVLLEKINKEDCTWIYESLIGTFDFDKILGDSLLSFAIGSGFNNIADEESII